MASINISEADFETLATAADDANQKGDMVAAVALDKLARKVNAALANASMNGYTLAGARKPKAITWQEVPTTLM